LKKGGLIGCGFFAQNHLHAWRDIDGADIVAICDRDSEKLSSTASAFGIRRTYDDAEAMLKAEALDFVDIATTISTHRPLVELVASHGRHVVCQKPFAENLQDGWAMVAACRKAGVHLMVHENFRWQSAIRAVKQRLDANATGRPFWGRCSFRSAFDVYAAQPYLAEDKRFIIQDLGIHILDIGRFLFGDVETLSARTQRVNPTICGEDVATIFMGHAGGVTSVVDCSYATILPQENFPQTMIEVDGDEGTLRLTQDYVLTIATREGSETIDVSPPLLSWAERPWHNIQESVFNIQRHFIDCLDQNIDAETSGEDNLRTLALVYAAYDSAADNGRLVKLGG
jgi:predicted dehydrogenase